MVVLQKTFADIWAEVGAFVKNDLAPTGTDLIEVKRYSNDGYLMFLAERDWTFLSPDATLTAYATSSAVLTTISTVTITAATAIFYDTMVGHTVVFGATENEFTIASVTSTTVAVLTASAAAESSTDTITITPDGNYRLPDNFGTLLAHPSFDSNNPYAVMVPRSPEQIRDMRSQTADITGPPMYYAVQPETFSAITGQRWEIMLFPTPSPAQTLSYRYRIDATKMTSDTEYPLGGPKHSLTIQQAAVAWAEDISGRVDGPQMKKYKTLLERSMALDDEDKPRNLGYNSDRSDQRDMFPQRGIMQRVLPDP